MKAKMTDLVKQLRDRFDQSIGYAPEPYLYSTNDPDELCQRAADEIERLNKVLGYIAAECWVAHGTDKDLAERWRKTATGRIEIARKAIGWKKT